MQTWFSPNCRWMNVHWIVPWRVDVFLEGAPDLKSMMTVIIWQYLTKDHITYLCWSHEPFEEKFGLNIHWMVFNKKKTYLSLTLDYVENKQINVFFSESKPCMKDQWIRGRWYRGRFVVKVIVFTTGQIV